MAVIAVYGSAVADSENIANSARVLGKFLAEAGHIMITGACPGVTHQAVLAASAAGGRTVGYSPATDFNAHVHVFRDPTEGFTEFIFVPRQFSLLTNMQACYKYRNISTAAACDAAIIINGRMGTLNEFTLAFDFGKVIGVLEQSGGVADRIRGLLDGLEGLASSASVLFDSDPVILAERVGEELLRRSGGTR